MRIGIFGGTFDPLHNGHIFAIQYALDEANIDRCLVIVSGDPWRKDNVVADAKTRLAWTVEVCNEVFDTKVIVDDREVKRQGPTYTIDTLEELILQYPDDEFILIVGEDIPPTMHLWKDVERIRELSEIFVVPREIVKVSSTEVRAKIAANQDVKGLIPEKIEREIQEKALYNGDTSNTKE